MTTQEANKIAWLAKTAAYKRPLLTPPRTTSNSRTFKVRTKKGKKNSDKEMRRGAGNSQTPHRYGRKIK